MGRGEQMKAEDLTDQLIDQIFEGLNDFKAKDDWEMEFLTSVRAYWAKSRRLSDKQKKRLLEIWERQNADPS